MSKDTYPTGIKYIIGNEGCERFSFYGMRSILTEYMIGLYATHMALQTPAAKALATQHYHLFTAGAYALPMIGAIVSDRLLGKYKTILYLSMVYCLGNFVLALTVDTVWGLHLGLALIALGSGGIKPCVAAHVGDQFGQDQQHLVQKIFSAFYFIINFGSFFATLLIPYVFRNYGPGMAFGIPGVLMATATLVFWLGRKDFIHVPPQPGGKLGALDALSSTLLFATIGSLFFTASLPWWAILAVSASCFCAGLFVFFQREKQQRDSGFLTLLIHSLRHPRTPGGDFFSPAEGKYGKEIADGPRAVVNILSVFVLVSVFWALFDQRSSSWVVQATEMNRTFETPWGDLQVAASQINALNPLFVMLLIPFIGGIVVPFVAKFTAVTPLRKMTAGMAISSLSFVGIALIQQWVDAAPGQVSAAWQIGPFVLITIGEVLVSVTGLEFAYTQAPREMKATIMGFWALSVTAGNLLVALLAGLKGLPKVEFFFVFAGLMALAALLFGIRARFYVERTILQR